MRGFTLIEILLALALISFIAGLAVPTYQAFQERNSLDVAINAITQMSRRGQLLAQGISGNSRWGIFAQIESITLFKGKNFDQRDPAFDEVFSLPINITPTGNTLIVFSEFTGYPQTTGTLTLNSLTETRSLIINDYGIITY